MATSCESVKIQMLACLPFHARRFMRNQQQGEVIDWEAAFKDTEAKLFNLTDSEELLPVVHYLRSLLRGETVEHALSEKDVKSLVCAMLSAAASSSLESYDLFCYLRHVCSLSEFGSLLLKKLYEASQPDENLTALHWAVICQQDTSKLAAASIQQDSRTPLHYAVVLNDAAALQQLLEQFPKEQNAQDDAGRSLVYMAASLGATHLLDILIAHGADIHLPGGPSGVKPLMLACSKGHADAVCKLIDAGADVNDDGILVVAAWVGSLSMVAKMTAAGARVDDLREGVSALFKAVGYNHPEIVSHLIKAGADVNAKIGGYTPLFSAAQSGYTKVVANLLEAGAYVDTPCHGFSPLSVAAASNQAEVVALLHAAGADMECPDEKITPLYYAIKEKNVGMMRLLLQLGSIISPEMVYEVISTDQCGILSVLLEHRPEIVRTLKLNGMPLLHIASSFGSLAMVELLINAGADVNALNDDNQMAHFCAYLHDNMDICDRLLAERARREYSPAVLSSLQALGFFSSSSVSDEPGRGSTITLNEDYILPIICLERKTIR